MPDAAEFVYRLPGLRAGHRPGSHRSLARGAGMQFAAHARLFDVPDPRRIDLRASLASGHRDWLVRTHYQRSATTVMALIDVSVPMHFGEPVSKLDVLATFVDALGRSAYGSGDALGMMGYDTAFRDALWHPPRHARAIGTAMAESLRGVANLGVNRGVNPGMSVGRRRHSVVGSSVAGLAECVSRLPANVALLFIASDFHGDLDALPAVLAQLGEAVVVPLVTWDPAEIEPPPDGALLPLADMRSAHRRSLWLRPSVRERWRRGVAERRAMLVELFKAHDMQPVFLAGRFDAEAMTRYFTEHAV